MNKENVTGNPHSNRGILNIDKDIKEKVAGNPPTNRGIVNREKDKKINKI